LGAGPAGVELPGCSPALDEQGIRRLPGQAQQQAMQGGLLVRGGAARRVHASSSVSAVLQSTIGPAGTVDGAANWM